MDKLDILAYLDRLEKEISLLRKEIKEIKIVFDKLPDIAEKDKEVLSVFLSKIKNSVEDVKIELSNFELFLKVGFEKIKKEIKEDIISTTNQAFLQYFEKEIPKILYVIQKTIAKQTFSKEIEGIIKRSVDDRINKLESKFEEIIERINVLALLEAKNKEDKLKLLLLTTKNKEIKKEELDKLFGKEVVDKVLDELKGNLKVKII